MTEKERRGSYEEKNKIMNTSDEGISGELAKTVENNPILTYEPSVSLRNYVKLYVLHFVYYATIGPVYYLLFFWIPSVRNSLMNLLFIRLNPWCFFQNLYWATTTVVWVFALVLRKYTTFDEALVYSTIMNTMYRSATISGKYSTYPEQEVERIFDGLIPASQVRGEMMIDSWNRQEINTLYTEAKSLSTREKLSRWPAEVCCELQVDTQDGADTRLSEKSHTLKEIAAKTTQQSVHSDLLVLSWARNYAPKDEQKISRPLVFIYALARALAPGFLNLIVGIKFHGETTEEAILFYVVALAMFMYFSVGPMFYLLACKDLRRSHHFSELAVNILQDKGVIFLKRLEWTTKAQKEANYSLVRKLHLYGDRFVQRHKAFASFMVVSILLLGLFTIPIISADSGWKYCLFGTSQQKMNLLIFADLVTLVIPLWYLLYLFAQLNSARDKLMTSWEKTLADRNMQAELDVFHSESKPRIKLSILGVVPTFGHNLGIVVFTLATIAGGVYIAFFSQYKIQA